MTRVLDPATTAAAVSRQPSRTVQPAYQSYLMLHVGFAVLPIVAGLDKFFHVLVNWDQYLAPLATRVLPVSGRRCSFAIHPRLGRRCRMKGHVS